MMNMKVSLFRALDRVVGLPEPDDYVAKLIETGEVKLALDFGCGMFSHLTKFRPAIETVGLDGHAAALDVSRAAQAHDHYVFGNILALSVEEIQDKIEESTGRRTVDLVTAFGSIEHMPKQEGWSLLDRFEKLTEKFILLDTPNGFVPQGPEFGNPFQRHLSGWYPADFEGLGYKVHGSAGTRYLRGYMGEKKIPLPGVLAVDRVLARVLFANRFARHGFNLTAIKDVRGVGARYPTVADWQAA